MGTKFQDFESRAHSIELPYNSVCIFYLHLLFNQGAVMQPVQSSPLNMYSSASSNNNNTVLPPQKILGMQNQDLAPKSPAIGAGDPFGSLL